MAIWPRAAFRAHLNEGREFRAGSLERAPSTRSANSHTGHSAGRHGEQDTLATHESESGRRHRRKQAPDSRDYHLLGPAGCATQSAARTISRAGARARAPSNASVRLGANRSPPLALLLPLRNEAAQRQHARTDHKQRPGAYFRSPCRLCEPIIY